jgi:hypothetical protein
MTKDVLVTRQLDEHDEQTSSPGQSVLHQASGVKLVPEYHPSFEI